MKLTTKQRKYLSILCHGSHLLSFAIVGLNYAVFLFLSFGLPILILLLIKDDIVRQNAKEAINFQINLCLFSLFSLILIVVLQSLSLILLGFTLFAVFILSLLFGFLILLISLFFPIIVIVNVIKNPSQVYRYGLKKYI